MKNKTIKKNINYSKPETVVIQGPFYANSDALRRKENEKKLNAERKARELEEFIAYFLLTEEESTDMDCTNNYESSEYTMEVGDEDLPF